MMSYATAVRAAVDAARIYGIDFSGYFLSAVGSSYGVKA